MPYPSDITQFNVRASLIKRLGEEIIPDGASAIVELIKNAYDADAENVTIEINTKDKLENENLIFKSEEQGYFTLEDDGCGMSISTLESNWLTFSITEKKKLKAETTTEKKRSPVGGQGMGRLGTVRLGRFVELFTFEGGNGETLHTAFDWNDFDESKKLTEVAVSIDILSRHKKKGTSIFISPLFEKNQWEKDNGAEIIETITNKIFYFIDRNSFRVRLRINGNKVELGKKKTTPNSSNKVFIENVWRKISQEVQQEVIRFWDDNKMIREGYSSEERAKQAVLLLRSESNNRIVGLSTAMHVTFKQLNNSNFYLYRSIILPGYRHPGLASKVIVQTRDILEQFSREINNQDDCIGMLTFVESPRIQQFRREAIWPASRMAYIGVDKNGRHIRVYYFKGAVI